MKTLEHAICDGWKPLSLVFALLSRLRSSRRSTVMMTWVCWWDIGVTFQMGSIQESGSAVGIFYVSGQKVAPSATASVGSLLPLPAQVGAQFGALVWMFVDSDFSLLLWNSPFIQILICSFLVFIWPFMFHMFHLSLHSFHFFLHLFRPSYNLPHYPHHLDVLSKLPV